MDELPEKLAIPLTDSVIITFQLIPAGSFRMGHRGEYDDEEPVHWVEITHPFYMGVFPVTQEQFAVWSPEHKNGFPNNPFHPAENLDWHQAVSFCEWLTGRLPRDVPNGTRADLPTEAQWEYACRAGTDTEYYTGDGEAALSEAGWFEENSGESTHPVGLKLPNTFGLFDMHGNVDEWCRDTWDSNAYKKRVDGVCDPVGEGDNTNADRVIRGGSWRGSAHICRAAVRFRWRPGYRDRDLGFRVCLFPGPVAAEQGTVAESQPVSGDGAEVN